jgi:hypothetical protein
MKNAVELFVSCLGSDAQPGTESAPLRTLKAAQAAVRKLKATHAVTVTVRAGTYELDEPLIFTHEDSGTNDGLVVWRAAPGEKVVISGGRTLSLDWKPFRDGIFSASLTDDLEVDQLYLNGERQHLARYPNYDAAVAIFNGYAADAISPERVARWADPTTAIVHAMHPGQWGGFSYRVVGLNADGTPQLEGGWQGNRVDKPHELYRFVENVFEELDAPGEFYADRRTRTLYIYPPAGIDLRTATVQVVSLRHLIELRGSTAAPVRWLTFRGFTFTQTARTFMETREPLLRSDWTIYRGGAFVFDGTEDCTLADCFFDQVGGNAVFVNNYNRRANVQACRIERSGAGGVTFVGDPAAVRSPLFEYAERQPVELMDRTPGPQSDNYPADCLVEDCLITQVGRFEKQSTGVGIDMAARITIRHCSIYDVPRAGINIGDGCWGGHVVEFCDVFDTVKETGDHGSFNSWGRDRYWLPSIEEVDALVGANPDLPLLDAVEPITLRNNRWRCDHGWDIDLDDGSSNYHIYNNLCLNGGIKNREGYHRVVENNVLVGNGFHPHVWYANSQDVFARNIVFTNHQPIRMPAVWGKQIDDNLLHDPAAETSQEATVLQSSSNQDRRSLRANARFADPASGDYTVVSDSPALQLGFVNFPMDRFGVRPARLKAIARTPTLVAVKLRQSLRDPTVRVWHGLSVRNVVGLGEQSAHGLSEETGVVVLDVPADSDMARAGIRTGDVLVAAGSTCIGDVQSLLSLPSDGASSLTVWREQRPVVIPASEVTRSR